MKKIKTAVMLLSVILAMQTISFPIYALKDNKYIINKRKDRREYYDITYSWEWFYSQDEDNTITLYYRHRFPPDMGLVALDYIGEPYFSGTVIVPDQINGITVTWVQGSCSAVGFDVNPENNYMECIDNVIFSKDGKILMAYPQNIPNTSYSIPDETEIIEDYAFSYTSVLENVTIPGNVNKIGLGAFVGSKELSEVVFLPDDSGLFIDMLAFRMDTDNLLKEITLPGFNVKIDRSAFGEPNEVPLLLTYEQPVLKTENRTIKWDKIPNTSYYEVYQKLDSGEYKLLKTTKGTSCRFGTLKLGKEYTFAVKPIAVIPAANYDKKTDEGRYPETFTIEGTMSEDISVKG